MDAENTIAGLVQDVDSGPRVLLIVMQTSTSAYHSLVCVRASLYSKWDHGTRLTVLGYYEEDRDIDML